jgi:ABC-type transport system involved in multi-copper enzyme maturation permease subunit
MNAMLTIASLTMREAVRRRLVAAFALISVVLVGLSGWGFYKLSHGTGFTSGETNLALPQAVVLLEFMFSFVVALSASAVASLAVSAEIDSGVLQTVVARPIRRSDVLLGKWLGLAGLLGAYTAIVSGLLVGVVYWTSGFVAPDPPAAAAFVFGEGVVLLTFVLLLSTRLPALAAGVIGVALFGMAWLAGVAGTLSTALHIHAMHTASEIGQYLLPTDGLWRGAIYYLEPSSFVTQQLAGAPVATGDPFLALSAPPWPYLAWAGIWLLLVLVLGVVSFERREL